MLDAGQLNKRVTIQYPVETRDSDYSAPDQDWEDFVSVWAAIQPLTGREFFLNRENQGEATVRIIIRSLDGVTEKMRVVWNEKIYRITAPPIDPFEAGVEMQLMCAAFTDET